MAADEDDKKKGQGRGFAGLSSLVSDVDATPPPAAKKATTSSTGTASGASRPAPQAAPPKPQSAPPQELYKPPQQPSSGSPNGKLWIGIAVVVGFLWLIGQSSKNTSSPSTAYSPPEQSTTLSYTPPAQPQAPSRPAESKPPVGQGLTFSYDQIAYCVAEDIRMDGAKSAIDNYSDSDVDRFNAMVADYNSRCSSFRYRRGALESVRSSIEPYRSQLQAEGRGKFARSPSTGSLSEPAPSRPAPDMTVQAIQRKLNELGYDAGAVDGLIGRGTRSAILAFQRDSGLVVDGNPTAALLQLLTASRQVERQEVSPPTRPPAPSAAVALPTYVPPTRDPTRRESASSTGIGIPQNAHLNYSGNDWECNRGYFRYSNECRAVQIPQNGKLTYLGNDWECNRGYFKYSNECRVVQIPRNGKLTYLGNDWECNRGYFKNSNECRVVQIPQNGKLTYLGNDWECEKGYRRAGDKCVFVYMQ